MGGLSQAPHTPISVVQVKVPGQRGLSALRVARWLTGSYLQLCSVVYSAQVAAERSR